jgi:diguanylate cyclase (GGDEF)-like protein
MPRRGSNPAKTGAAVHRNRGRGELAAPEAEDQTGGPLSRDVPGHAATSESGEAVSRLAAERDRLREELAKARLQIASLERLADEDALTPLANRRAFLRQLARMIAFTRRYGAPASIVYLDVNNLKQVNDSHGHAAGDAALRHVATVPAENTRTSDLIGRLGGDEFGVILAHTDEAHAQRRAAVLAEAVVKRPLRWNEATIALSVAYGVYALSDSDDPQRAIEAADKAMYRQKRAVSSSRR